MENKILEMLWERLNEPRVIFLATSVNDQPRIRPVSLFRLGKRLFVHSFKETAKVKQVKKNSQTEFCLYLGESLTLDPARAQYIRVRCIAQLNDDKDIKTKLFDQIDYIRNYNDSPDDPDYILIELKPVKYWLT